MLRQKRFGQQDHQQVTEDVDLGHGGVFARRTGQAGAALEMFEGNFDAPPPEAALFSRNSRCWKHRRRKR